MAILRAIKEAIPGADDRSPAEVLSFTLDAIRSASATTIEASSARQTDGNGPDIGQFYGYICNVSGVLGSHMGS